MHIFDFMIPGWSTSDQFSINDLLLPNSQDNNDDNTATENTEISANPVNDEDQTSDNLMRILQPTTLLNNILCLLDGCSYCSRIKMNLVTFVARYAYKIYTPNINTEIPNKVMIHYATETINFEDNECLPLMKDR